MSRWMTVTSQARGLIWWFALVLLWTGAGALWASPRIQDDVFSDQFMLDRQLNLVRRIGTGSLYQQRPEQGTHHYVAGADLRYNAQFVDSEWTRYPAAWPLFHPGALAKAGPNTYSAWTWTNATPGELLPPVAGPHHLWIRWVRWKQLPAPLEVRLEQNGEVLLQETIGADVENVNSWQAQVVWELIGQAKLDTSPVKIKLEKPQDEQLAGDRIVDGLYLTSDLNYVPVGRVQLPQIAELRRRAERLGGGAPFVTWVAETPWAGYDLHEWPTGGEITSNATLSVCQNEQEPFLLKLTSMSEAPLRLPLRAEPLRDSQGREYDAVEVRVAALMETAGYGWMMEPLFRRSSVGLAPYHTAGLWVTVDTTGLPAGQYTGDLVLGTGTQQTRFGINLTVHPIRLERRPEFWTGVWGGPPPAPEGVDAKELYLRDLAAHGNNYLMHHAGGFVDYAALIHELGFVAGHEAHGGGVWWAHFMSRTDYDSQDFHDTLIRALSGTAEVRDALGFDGQHFSTQFEDEQRVSEHWERVLRAAKETGIELLLRMNPTHLTPEDIRRMDDLVDIWKPHENVLIEAATVEALQPARGKAMTYGIYYLDNANPESSWRRFRRLPWKAFAAGLEGCAFWRVAAYNGEPWDDLDATGSFYGTAYAGQAAVVYPGTAGPVPTPAWKAWRAGRDDVDLLYVLRDEIRAAREVGRSEAAHRAQLTLDTALELVLNADNPHRYAQARRMVVDAILQLRG